MAPFAMQPKSGPVVLVYAPGLREFGSPEDLAQLAKLEGVSKRLDYRGLDALSDERASEVSVNTMPMLDATLASVDNMTGATPNHVVLVASKDNVDEAFRSQDTAPVARLIELGLSARAVESATTVLTADPASRDHAATELLPAIVEAVAALEPSRVFVAIGPSTPAVQMALLLAAQSLRSLGTEVDALELKKSDTVGSGTEVVSLHLPRMLTERSVLLKARGLLTNWQPYEAAVLVASMPNIGADLVETARAVQAWAEREERPALALVERVLSDRDSGAADFGWSDEQWAVAKLIDRLEVDWKAKRSAPWLLGFEASLLLIDLVPVAWFTTIESNLSQHEARIFSSWADSVASELTDTGPLQGISTSKDRKRDAGWYMTAVLVAASLPSRATQAGAVVEFPPPPRFVDFDKAAGLKWLVAALGLRQQRNELAHSAAVLDWEALEELLAVTAPRLGFELLAAAVLPRVAVLQSDGKAGAKMIRRNLSSRKKRDYDQAYRQRAFGIAQFAQPGASSVPGSKTLRKWLERDLETSDTPPELFAVYPRAVRSRGLDGDTLAEVVRGEIDAMRLDPRYRDLLDVRLDPAGIGQSNMRAILAGLIPWVNEPWGTQPNRYAWLTDRLIHDIDRALRHDTGSASK